MNKIQNFFLTIMIASWAVMMSALAVFFLIQMWRHL